MSCFAWSSRAAILAIAAGSLGGCGGGVQTGGAGTPSNPNAGKGVVVSGACTPLCANAASDPDGDGWGFEGASCVVPNTTQAKTRIPCTPGGPVPTTVGPPAGSPGVVADTASGRSCVGLCDAAVVDDGSGWGWEFETSCVVPGSVAATSAVPCQVGAPVPTTMGPAAGSPGVIVDTATGRFCVGLCTMMLVDNGTGFGFELGASCVIPGTTTATTALPCRTGEPISGVDQTGMPGRLLNEICTPYCRAPGADPDGDGWGYELGAACLVAGSPAATMSGIDCKIGEDILASPVVLNPQPPAGTVTKPATVASTGFFVANGRLYDKFGNPFIIRGVNNLHIYFDASNQYLAYQALDEIAAYGVNTIRIVWMTTGSASNLARIIRRVVELHMIPMVELHDVTGGTTNEGLLQMAQYLVRADVKQVLLAYQDFLLVNIANEWSGTDFRNGYLAAISVLRLAGVNHTLVIDANNFGQNVDSILTDGGALLDGDTQHNLLFSLHMYQDYSTSVTGRAHITSALQQPTTAGLPLIVGEFGWQAGGTAVDSAFIMSECVRLGLGYIAWSWKGNNQSLAYLDMAVDWPGQTLTNWGTDVLKGVSGIGPTAKTASLFAP